jgi:hypothetical protein
LSTDRVGRAVDGVGTWHRGRVTTPSPSAAQLHSLDAVIHQLGEARQGLRTVVAAAEAVMDATAWRSRAVATYRERVHRWRAELGVGLDELGDQEHDLRTIRASWAAMSG